MDLIEFHMLKRFMKEFSSIFIDPVDKLNIFYTMLLLIIMASSIFLRCIIFEPIYCWVPYEFPSVWESYVNSFCWVQPTFILQANGSFPTNLAAKKASQTNYYQWVLMMFIIHLLFNWLPQEIWRLLNYRIGLNIRSRVHYIYNNSINVDKEFEDDLEEFAKSIVDMLQEKTNALLTDDIGKRERWLPLKYLFDKRSSSVLFYSYLLMKFVTITVIILQIYIMQSFLGNIGWNFGPKIVSNLYHYGLQSWRVSGLFPREVGCDVTMQRTGAPVTYSVRCVLPANMLSEKFYIILWFWFVICAILTFGSIIMWIYRLARIERRKEYINHLLEIYKVCHGNDNDNSDESNNNLESSFHSEENEQSIRNRRKNDLHTTTSTEETKSLVDNDEEKQLYLFTKNFLRIDGVFIIHMITNNLRIFITSQILFKIYEIYKERKRNLDNNKIV